jgi:hypothetical protein
MIRLSNFARVSTVARVSAVTAMTAALFVGGAIAQAETTDATTTDVTTQSSNPFSSLLQQSAGDSAATGAVTQLFGAALKPAIGVDQQEPEHEFGISLPKPFMYPAPTAGCSIDGGSKMGVTLGVAMTGPNYPLPPHIERGHVLFKSVPGFVADPNKSDIQVAWINLSNGKNGIAKLDGDVAGVPMIAKDVETGEGHIMAAMFGSIKTTGGKSCQILVPTVGQFEA